MKVILTGATGFVGSEVLEQLLRMPAITQVTCLTRRAIAFDSPKLRTLLHSDFSAYDEPLARDMASHAACIWTLGGKAADAPDSESYRRGTFTFPFAFATAVAERIAAPFQFCYLSGMGADPSESARLPWQRETRHLKGRTERALYDLQRSSSFFHATSFRPAGILPKGANHILSALLAPIVIGVDTLSRAMVRRATSPDAEVYTVLSHRQIKKLARE